MTIGNGNAPETDDERFMNIALREATIAFEESETPIGAVVVHSGKVIGRGHNRNIALGDPTAHAEMIAITAAAGTLGDRRPEDCDLYCTIEPCVMCAGAAVLARMRRIIYGASEPKFGGCETVYQIPTDTRLNHKIDIVSGVCAARSAELMREFFKKVREKSK